MESTYINSSNIMLRANFPTKGLESCVAIKVSISFFHPLIYFLLGK